jgi:hypothetical protein
MIPQKLLEQIIQKYGETNQLNIVKEEASELIKSIIKLERAQQTQEDIESCIDSVAEEEADMRIMLDQLDIIMIKRDPGYRNRVKCETDRKELRIKKMLGIDE